MMIGPEAYYDLYLKGKNERQIMTKIRSLKREISHLKNVMEHPEYQCMLHPREDVRIWCNRLYLNRAKQALAEVGGTYVSSKAELKAEEFNANIPYISKVEFCIGEFFGGFETRTYIIDGDSVHLDFEHSLILKPCNLEDDEAEEMDKESFFESLADLHIGEWRKNYDLSRFGYAVLDGTQWHLYIYFSNGHRTVKIHGNNDYPYNFNRLTELFGIDDWEVKGEEE